MGIFELRVWRGDSLQSWRFGVAFGVNIPLFYCNVINRKKITFQKRTQTQREDTHNHKQTDRGHRPQKYIYLSVID